jgi:hypothetical protein
MLDFYHQPEGHVITQTQVYEKDEVKSGYISSIYQQPGGLLLMTGTCFTDFAHAIEARDADIINDLTCNRHLLTPLPLPLPPSTSLSSSSTDTTAATATTTASGIAVGTSIPRSGRVSIVMWSG